jgi:hypothetical protein
MRNVERRLQVLERSPQFQPPPSPIQEIEHRAFRQVSNEDLQLMKLMAMDVAAGVPRTLTDRESAVLVAHAAALEVEAQQMGFRSFAHAERRWGRSR